MEEGIWKLIVSLTAPAERDEIEKLIGGKIVAENQVCY